MWMAMVEQANKDHDAETEADFRKSIADLDPKSSQAATSRTLFAIFLRKHERAAEAEPLEKEASEIKQTLVKNDHAESEVLSKFALNAGGDVSRPALVSKVEPEYTEEARAAKFQGVAVLYIVVEPDGSPSHIRVVKSLGLGLDEKAIEAVQKWHFKPGVKNGVAVPVAATVEVNFKLL
jgi:TonB family protein